MNVQTQNAQIQSIKFLNTFAFVATVAINMLAQTLPLAGHTTAEISAKYPTLLTPAGLTFGIWFLIYALLGVFVLQQAIGRDEHPTKEIGWAFAFGCAMNIAWIVCWHYEIMLLATAAIIGLWFSLLKISKQIESENPMAKVIFSIYYAWISFAAAAQIYIYVSLLAPRLNENAAAVTISVLIMLAISALTLRRLYMKRDFLFGLTVMWSLAGIFIRHIGELNMKHPLIAGTSAALTVAIAAVILVMITRAGETKAIPET